MKKLAILVIGRSGVGKTTTWRTLLKKSIDFPLHRKAWPIQPYDDFSELSIEAFIQGSSPTEMGRSLKELLDDKLQEYPRILLCSEQSVRKRLSKKHIRLSETLDFLIEQNYQVKIIWITNNVVENDAIYISERDEIAGKVQNLKFSWFDRDDDKRIKEIKDILKYFIEQNIATGNSCNS